MVLLGFSYREPDEPQMVLEGIPIANDSTGVLDGFKGVMMHTLFFDRLDKSFEPAVLLGAMRGNELLLQSAALHQCGIVARGEDQPVIRTKPELRLDLAERTVTSIAPQRHVQYGQAPSGTDGNPAGPGYGNP